jgi:hypothetical protein
MDLMGLCNEKYEKVDVLATNECRAQHVRPKAATLA